MMPSMTPKMTSASGGKVNLQFKYGGYKYVKTHYAGDPLILLGGIRNAKI